MVNRKGFIKIVEATIAIMIIMTVFLITFSKNKNVNEIDYSEEARTILDEIANNFTFRTDLIQSRVVTNDLTNFLDKRVKQPLNYEIRTCDVSSACGQSTYQGVVYSAERIISSDIKTLNPIKVRLFLWVG